MGRTAVPVEAEHDRCSLFACLAWKIDECASRSKSSTFQVICLDVLAPEKNASRAAARSLAARLARVTATRTVSSSMDFRLRTVTRLQLESMMRLSIRCRSHSSVACLKGSTNWSPHENGLSLVSNHEFAKLSRILHSLDCIVSFVK
jgi:hypothetical protein